MKLRFCHSYLGLLRQMLAADWKVRIVLLTLLFLLFFLFFWDYNLSVSEHVADMTSQEAMVQNGIYGFFQILIILSFISLLVGFSSASSLNFFRLKVPSFYGANCHVPERFGLIVTRSLVFVIINAFLAMLLAELLQMAFLGHYPLDYYSRIDWGIVREGSLLPAATDTLLVKMILIASLFILMNNAWFTFCATVFRRHPFLFGILMLWFIGQLISIITFFLTDLSSEFLKWADGDYSSLENVELMEKCCYFCDILINAIVVSTVSFWLIAYSRLKNIEI